jgi:hypothetical protein
MRNYFLAYLLFIFFNPLVSQTFCALVSFPDFSNGYHCPQAYIDENLKVLYKESKDPLISERIFEYKNGLGKIRYSGKFGFIDHTGKVVIPDTFDKAEDFNEGLAQVQVKGKWGYINTKGQIVIEPKYKTSHRFSCGLAAFDDNGKHGYINQEGKIIIPAIYDRVSHFKDNKAWVLYKGKWGYINKSGAYIIQPQYKDTYDFNEGFCWVKTGMEWALIDTTNKIIIPFSQQNHLVYAASGAKKILSNIKYGLLVTKEKGKTGFSSVPDLKKVIVSKFDEVLPFEDSLAVAYLDGKCGVIDIKGEFFIEPKYEEIKYLGNRNIFAVRVNKNWRILYRDSGKISKEEFENVHNFEVISKL